MSDTHIKVTGWVEDTPDTDKLVVTEVDLEEDKVVFTMGDSEPMVMVGKGAVSMLLGEGIVAVLSKAVAGEDGYAIDNTAKESGVGGT